MSTPDGPECDHHEHESLRSLKSVTDDTLEKAARIFRALGDPGRLRLLTILSEGEACVSELADKDQLSTISQRLRTLRSENLVSRKRNGKHIIYGLADDHVLDMIFNALAHAGEKHE
jgi:ArsR family transcriptional regulator